jgi:uncharacterized protein (TIGR02147 family)
MKNEITKFEATANPAVWLRQELVERVRRNPSYSLRAFAKQLGIPASRVSDIINEKRPITANNARLIAHSLGLNAADKDFFLKSILEVKRKTKLQGSSQKLDYIQIQDDIFSSISEWYHFAVLELTKVEGFRSDVRWISRRLGVSPHLIREAIDRLVRLNMLVADKNGNFKMAKSFTTTHDIPSSALVASHKQSLELAIKSLSDTPVSLRDVSSITFAMNIKKIPEAKARIQKFRRQLTKHLESGPSNEVYNLNIQLVPVSRSIECRTTGPE